MSSVPGLPKLPGFKVHDPVRVPIASLTEDPDNVNAHSDQDLNATGESLEKFGQLENLVIDVKTNRVIGGNGRLRKMVEKGWKDVLVIPVEGSESQLKTLAITLNKTGRNSEFDFEKLIVALREIEEEDGDLLHLTGFPEHELVPLLNSEMDLSAGFDESEFETDEPSTPGDDDLSDRGMQVQFSLSQKAILDRAFAHFRAEAPDPSITPSEILTRICDDYIRTQE